MTPYVPSSNRYDSMHYRRCGRSGLLLPELSLGLWQNFGDDHLRDVQRAILRRAHSTSASRISIWRTTTARLTAARRRTSAPFFARTSNHCGTNLIISTKAGWDMWPGPYGDHGSRKYLLASLDQSLGRLGIDYVDIFYHHRFDPDTPLEETLGALDAAVRQGKALYVGVSSYSDRRTERGGHHSPRCSERRSLSIKLRIRCSIVGSRNACSMYSSARASDASLFRRSRRAF